MRNVQHKLSREGHIAQYLRLPQLLTELHIAKGDRRYSELFAVRAKTDSPVLDDEELVKFTIEHWHQIILDLTLADAILDRLIHNAYENNMKGKLLQKKTQRTIIKPTSDG